MFHNLLLHDLCDREINKPQTWKWEFFYNWQFTSTVKVKLLLLEYFHFTADELNFLIQ